MNAIEILLLIKLVLVILWVKNTFFKPQELV